MFKLKRIISIVLSIIMLCSLLPANLTAVCAEITETYELTQYYGYLNVSFVKAGDINGDKKTDNRDLMRLFQYLTDWDVDVSEGALDVNGDTSTDNRDLVRLFQYLTDWDVEIFPENTCQHNGATEIRNELEPTCSQEGYTGDTYCLICGDKISTGSVIPATGFHTGGTATCHSKAICEVCGQEYGNFNPYYHDGGTEVRGAYPATCMTSGYEGTTYCLGCGEAIAYGSYPSPTGIHLHTEVRDAYPATCSTAGYTGTTYCTDCGLLLSFGDYTEPTGIHLETSIRGAYPATCTSYGYTGDKYCTACGAFVEAGTQINPTGHLHTEVRDAYPAECTRPGYTGDTYCTDCGELLVWGTYTEPTGHLHTELCGDYPATAVEWGYTGDTYCTDCGEVVEYGTVIEPLSAFVAKKSLSDNQKGLYEILKNAIENLDLGWIDVTEYAASNTSKFASDCKVALAALSYDRPDIFWMPKKYQISRKSGISTVSFSAGASDTARGYYNVTQAERDAMIEQLNNVVNELVHQAMTLENDFERELLIHDYLCANIVYDSATATNPSAGDYRSYTVYGALCVGTCVCEGYSRAMQLLCQKLNISCGLVGGTAGEGDGPHMWNIINIGDETYFLDITFDDTAIEDLPIHAYFNLSKEEFEYDHTFDNLLNINNIYIKDDFNFFECDDYNTLYNYYNYTGAYIESANNVSSATEYIKRRYALGDVIFEIRIDPTIDISTAWTNLYLSLYKEIPNIQVFGTEGILFPYIDEE